MPPLSSNSREEVSLPETTSRRMQRLNEIYESCNYSVMEPESFKEAEKQEVWMKAMKEELGMMVFKM